MQREFSAGGVLVRRLRGRWAVAAIRPAGKPEGVWALPKGRIGPGEEPAATAVREVEEETGVRARIVGELAPTHYRDRKGRPKTVRWYRMEVEDAGTFEPDAEVDELRWLAPKEAGDLVSYDHDRALLETLV
jgi:8-oxo-dGTP pyrophosphatase MutT (NUDIX family)